MNVYCWHNAYTNDPCLEHDGQQQLADYFNGSAIDQRKIVSEYAIEFAPANFLEQLLEFPIIINEQIFHFEQFEIREYVEIPFECPHGLIVYQLVIKAIEFPHNEFMHIFVNRRYQIIGSRIEINRLTPLP